jgi:acyl-CoA reductase-like NAD-dependent aldehyde dehydrogenase
MPARSASTATRQSIRPFPSVGNRQSGWGREFGREGLDAYLKTKATTVIY